jgi:hypothetical protein
MTTDDEKDPTPATDTPAPAESKKNLDGLIAANAAAQPADIEQTPELPARERFGKFKIPPRHIMKLRDSF